MYVLACSDVDQYHVVM